MKCTTAISHTTRPLDNAPKYYSYACARWRGVPSLRGLLASRQSDGPDSPQPQRSDDERHDVALIYDPTARQRTTCRSCTCARWHGVPTLCGLLAFQYESLARCSVSTTRIPPSVPAAQGGDVRRGPVLSPAASCVKRILDTRHNPPERWLIPPAITNTPPPCRMRVFPATAPRVFCLCRCR